MSDRSRILIVDDDRDYAEALKVILETHGYVAEAVDRPEVGLQRALELLPDLIVLDVMFGEAGATEGFDYAIKIRQNEALAHTPILMLTAVNAHYPGFRYSDKTDGEYLPVDAFVEKPVLALDLIEQVKALLRQKTSKWRNWPRIAGPG